MTAAGAVARRRVLVVDDCADLAESMAAALELLGCDPRTCSDGAGGLLSMAEWTPEIVFLDLTLPDISGMDVLHVARRSPWGRGMLMIAMTGWSSDAQRESALAAGFDVFVEKPFDLDALQALLAARHTPLPKTQSFD